MALETWGSCLKYSSSISQSIKPTQIHAGKSGAGFRHGSKLMPYAAQLPSANSYKRHYLFKGVDNDYKRMRHERE